MKNENEIFRVVCPQCDGDFPVMQCEWDAHIVISCPDCGNSVEANEFSKLAWQMHDECPLQCHGCDYEDGCDSAGKF